MVSATTDTSKAQLTSLLAILRDEPRDSQNVTDSEIFPVYSHLMSVPEDAGFPHWFCTCADQVTQDAAAFLIRLYAYDGDHIEKWRKNFAACLTGCCECVRAFEVVKVTSRRTYMAAFPASVLDHFYEEMGVWEQDTVLKSLSNAGLSTDSISTSTYRVTLGDAPPATIYRIVWNLSILMEHRIVSILRARPPQGVITAWPPDPPPPGLFILLLDQNEAVRKWARSQAFIATKVPIAKDSLLMSHKRAVKFVTSALTASGTSNSPIVQDTERVPEKQESSGIHTFSSDQTIIWSGFCLILRLLPAELYVTSASWDVDIRRVVLGHLHDVGPHFVDVFRSFLFLLKRMGSSLWATEAIEYPQIVFDAIKDNPSFSELLSDTDLSGDNMDTLSWQLGWFFDFLQSIQEPTVFSDVLAKIIDFMCEELQHERFKDVRPKIMLAATRLLSSLLRKYRNDNVSRLQAIENVLDIHSDIFIGVALGRAYNDPQWSGARSTARDLVMNALYKDVAHICNAIMDLCKFLAGHDVKLAQFTIRSQFWKKAYDTLQTHDVDGVAMLISVLARSGHLDLLNKGACLRICSVTYPKSPKHVVSVQGALDLINQSLQVTRIGAMEALSKFAYASTPSFLIELLSRRGMVSDVINLMLSPVEDLQNSSQTLVGQAFDVDMRIECFRALLSNHPDDAVEGILQFLHIFIQHAPPVPEACSLAKSLVRCLTDVIEVLCSSHDGLLRSDIFLRPSNKASPAARLPALWTSMTKATTIIFKRTPSWSASFDPDDMIVWMRDALIFGRDMLAQRRVIETSALQTTAKPASRFEKQSELSYVGKVMLDDLQGVLLESARWLRLTDEELLHQSFSLIQSLLDCFRECNVPPSPDAIAKLQKHIDDARKKDPSRPQTRLDSARLSKLQESIDSFSEDDDEIQFISSTTRAPPEKLAPKTNSRPKQSIHMSRTADVKKHHENVGTRRTSGASLSRFTDRDQKRLEAASTIPSFRRTSVGTVQAATTSSRTSSAKVVSSRGSPTELDSTSDESDSSDEDTRSKSGLAALAKLQRSPVKKKPAERRPIKLLDTDLNIRKKTVVDDRDSRREDARRTTLRLKPDVANLHRAILSWDYDQAGPEPPLSRGHVSLSHVADTFSDYDHYRQVFEPLLLLECWSQVIRSKEETQETYDCSVGSRHFVSDWLDLEVTISGSVRRDWFLAETDVVLFRHPEGKKSVLAKVMNYKAMPWGAIATIRLLGSRDPGLQMTSIWKLSKIFSLSTIHREYAALLALPYYDLFERILRPRLARVRVNDATEIKRAMEAYSVNEPQAVAILSALQSDDFALIQGPPGTGKTSTICGLVEAFLEKRLRSATAINVGKDSKIANKDIPKKVLLCAPSNAAIDEVAHRVKEGFRGAGRRNTPPKVVRVGADKSMNISVKDISLDSLVDEKLNRQGNATQDVNSELTALRGEIDKVKKLRQQKFEERSAVRDNASRTIALDEKIKQLNSRRMQLMQQFDRLKDKQKSDGRTRDALYRKFRLEVVAEADVICSTLSGAGHEILESFDFEMVIIDEAAQAIELSSLIPLRYKCRRCIMVGDPQQLPPTVISQEACKYMYNQSLFVRLQKHQPDAVHLLSIQYRMHPDISQLPSRVFYQGRLQDGPDMAAKTSQLWHTHEKFGTYRFFNVSRGQETETAGHSLKNITESRIAVALYARLRQEFSKVDLDFRIGVVSMYRAQIGQLRRDFEERFGKEITHLVDFNTVDGFQGQEKDIIILSCVRAGPGLQSIGFLADTRRMNVAMTRAKSSLFILGHAPTLERSDANWKHVIVDARSRNCLTDVEVSYFTAPAPVSVPTPSHRSPTIARKSKTSLVPSIPTGLITPKAMKTAANRVKLGHPLPEKPKQERPVPGMRPPSSSGQEPGSSNSVPSHTEHRNIPKKRPFETGNTEKAPNTNDSQSVKSRPPPVKRQKQVPNLFIPKANKRPAPGDNGGNGPPNNKRQQ